MIGRQLTAPGKLIGRSGLARSNLQAYIGRITPPIVRRILEYDRASRAIRRDMKGRGVGLGELRTACMPIE